MKGGRSSQAGRATRDVASQRPFIERRWSIPNTPRDLSILDTYTFSSSHATILMASTQFPTENTTRDAFLIALQERNLDPKRPIRIAIEFNIGRESGRNRHNIRLEGRAAGPIVVRCRGSFANDAVRKKADDFFAFLDKNKLIAGSPGIALESLDDKQYARIIKLDGPDVSGCWTVLVGRLSWFASVVSDFKTAPAQE
ncbi:hypothetical protein [Archangium lansingense]|uniref:Uncharacterized protein n=1 Tax=Archangium lansingense TaxID=2995310 RepID=A0ABT3ZW47_9BACT|nr:hypothetical protein [Archangium lansinium]MCY1072969.1 hypothetical protein [Archangium lansinium]